MVKNVKLFVDQLSKSTSKASNISLETQSANAQFKNNAQVLAAKLKKQITHKIASNLEIERYVHSRSLVLKKMKIQNKTGALLKDSLSMKFLKITNEYEMLCLKLDKGSQLKARHIRSRSALREMVLYCLKKKQVRIELDDSNVNYRNNKSRSEFIAKLLIRYLKEHKY